MTKEEFIEEVAALPGVGKAKAEALYEAGFTSVEELQDAAVDDLTEVSGIGARTAEAILQGLEAQEEVEDQEIEVVDEEAEEPAEEEVVEEGEYRVKRKPDLPDEIERDLAVRAARKDAQPSFKRQQHYQYKKLKNVWRAPKGLRGKQRREKGYRPDRVKVGYGTPESVRGLHPSGFEEVLVHNVDDLEAIDPTRQAARIGGTVGGRKREAIETRAEELEIRVLNPTGRN